MRPGATVMVYSPHGQPLIARVTGVNGSTVTLERTVAGAAHLSTVSRGSVISVDDVLNALRQASDRSSPRAFVGPIPIVYGEAILAYVRDLEDRLGIEQSPWAGEGEE